MFAQLIKAQTAQAHASLEQNPHARALLSESATNMDYANYLTRLYPFIQAFESNFYPQASIYFSDLDRRRKTPLIESDLKIMNIHPESLYCYPKTIIKTWFEDDNQIIGGLYVLEGSTLGAKLIARRLSNRLNPVANAFHYFNAYGENTNDLWRLFLQRLEEVAEPHRQPGILKGGVRCFELIEACMNRHPG